MKRNIEYLLAVGAIALVTSSASATVIKKKSLAEMFTDSELVFTGTLLSAVYDLDETGLPWTLYTFSQLDILAGNYEGGSFSLRCPGGVLDGIVTKVGGTPDFEVGDKSLVFFDEHDWCQVAGWFQGEFKIIGDPEGSGEPVVVNNRGQGVVALAEDGFVFGGRIWTPAQRTEGVRLAPEGAFDYQAVGLATPWVVVRGELEAFWRAMPAAVRSTKAAAKSQSKVTGEPLPTTGVKPGNGDHDEERAEEDFNDIDEENEEATK